MRRFILSLTLLLALVPPVLARGQSGVVPTRPGAAGVVAQGAPGEAYYLSVLELYGLQSAASASPATKTQIAQAMSEYFSNGARVTGVPSAGPAAAYYTRGAEVSTIPTSVMPDYEFSPPFAPPVPSPVPAPADASAPPSPTDAGAPPLDANQPLAGNDAAARGLLLGSPPNEVVDTSNAAPESASEPASDTAPARALASTSTAAAETASPPETAPALASTFVPETETTTSFTTILVLMAGGMAAAGGLVFLGLRIRPR